MDYQDPLGYGLMDLEEMNLVMGSRTNTFPVHAPYNGAYGLPPPPPEMMNMLPIPSWSPAPSRKRRPPDILGRSLTLIPVSGAPPDTFIPVSPVAGRPLSPERIQVQHRRGEIFSDPINPAMHYGNSPPCPASWGRVQKSGEPMFTYTENGELKHDRVLSRSEMREYLYGRQFGNSDIPWVSRRPLPGEQLVEGKLRHGLTLWIGWTPTQVSHRYPSPMSNKCRLADCAIESRTIKSGQLRVALDERMNVDGKYDPFHCASFVHLFCLEKHFDILKLMDDLDVRLDRRVLMREMKNLADLDAHGLGRVRTAVRWLSAEWPRLKEHEDYVACRRANGDLLTRSETDRPRHFDDSLTKTIQVYDNVHYQSSGRKMRRRRRRLAAEEAAAEGTQAKEICDADTHMGNLDYIQTVNSKRRTHDKYGRSLPPEEVAPRPSWLESLVPPDSYAPWMFTDGFIPSLTERLAPREPIGCINNQYISRPAYHSPRSLLGMNLFQPPITQTALNPDFIESEYYRDGDLSYWFDPNGAQSNAYNTHMPVTGVARLGQAVYAPPEHVSAMPPYLPSSDLDINLNLEPDLEVQEIGWRPVKRGRAEDDAAGNEGSSNPKRIRLDTRALDEPVASKPSRASMVPEGSIDPWARVEPIRPQPPEADIPQDSIEDADLSQYVNGDNGVDDLFADDGSFDFGPNPTTIIDLTEDASPKRRPSPITVPGPGAGASQSQFGNQGEQPKTALTFSSRGVKRALEDDGEQAKPHLRRTRSI